MTPITTINEYLERLWEYQSLGDQELARGRVHSVEALYIKGSNYSNRAIKPAKNLVNRLSDCSPAKVRMLQNKSQELHAGVALYYIKQGASQCARRILGSAVLKDDDLPKSQKATARCYHGLALVAEGAEHETL